MPTELQIRTAAKLYDCRNTAKRFYKNEYHEKLMPYIHILKEVMKANNLNEMEALLKISKTEMYQDNPMNQILFMSAVVEVIEPSKP